MFRRNKIELTKHEKYLLKPLEANILKLKIHAKKKAKGKYIKSKKVTQF